MAWLTTSRIARPASGFALLLANGLREEKAKGDSYLQTARLLALTLLAITPVLAQSQLPNETLAEVRDEVRNEINSPSVYTPNAYTPAAAASLPDAPAPQKVIDKKFIAVMGALAGAESVRFTTHKLVLDHEHAAGAPWVTSVPANQYLVAKYAGIYAAELLVGYELKKPHNWLPGDKIIRKFWWVYPAAMVAIHTKNAVRSIRTQAPAGCPVAACQ